MSLTSAIRAALGVRSMKLENDPEKEDETSPDAEGEEENKPEAEGENEDSDAEGDEDAAPDAEGEEDDIDGEEEDETDRMSAAERRAYAAGRKAERRRIGAILGSAAAEANPGLAAHLAFRSGDAPKKALAALKAGGASRRDGLADRMAGRNSRTGRGGEQARSADMGAKGWDKAMARAGVKLRG